MQQFSTSPIEMAASIWRSRSLIFQMTKREVLGRYRGSVLGLGWSLFHPLVMLAIYTFVFSVVFRARWPGMAEGSTTDFALLLFVGMILHALFAECVNRAPSLILANPNYVKKIVFPLEILPCVAMGSAVFHGGISLVVMLLALLLTHGTIPWTIVLIPFVLLPLLCATLGIAWFLSAVGVYIRDIVQVTGIVTTIFLFISPVFFPLSAVPQEFQIWLKLNPLTFVIEAGRNVLIFGRSFDWIGWTWYLVGSFAIAWAGFWWFQKTRRGFADVV
jgi:homopolymeric O-antigen transport system permease protein